MNRLDHAFDNGKTFVAFLTAGQIGIDQTVEHVLA